MRVNPLAPITWAFLTGVGFLIGGGTGAITGLVIGLGLSLLAEFL